MKVYEAVDSTDDERYFPFGIWETLEQVEKAFDTEDADDIPDESAGREDSLTVEIREHELGAWDGHGKLVKKLEWRQTYDSAKDEYVWFKVKEHK